MTTPFQIERIEVKARSRRLGGIRRRGPMAQSVRTQKRRLDFLVWRIVLGPTRREYAWR